jgi:hypothetical protein
VTVIVGTDCRPAPIHNLAGDGIGFLLNRALDPGTVVRLELENQMEGLWLLKGGRVIHATALENGQWLTGVTFLTGLTALELRGILRA